MSIASVLLLLLFGPPADPALDAADALAARARAETEPGKRAKAVEVALQAYAALLVARPKDRRFVPLARRRRASLLKREKRYAEALAEHDAIVAGRARRKDRARALFDGAALLERLDKPEEAAARYAQTAREFPDRTRTSAQAHVARGRVLERLGKPAEAQRAYCFVIKRCRDEEKLAIEAYDRLALLAIARGDPVRARRWLYECVGHYERRASRGDKKGAFISRLLGDMKAPRELTKALAKKEGG